MNRLFQEYALASRQIYQPPFRITPGLLRLTADIGEAVGRLSETLNAAQALRLRRANRVRTIQGSLAIEGNTLSEEQITAILNGKRVLAAPREILEAENAIAAYDRFEHWNPQSEQDLLEAHGLMMRGLLPEAGKYRRGGVGVVAGERVVHLAPPARLVPVLMRQFLHWLASTDHHPLIAGAVFHFEFEFIHPFLDGNGRLGRLWQTLILFGWNPMFAQIPVESLIRDHQAEYYQALRESTEQADCSRFIEFMLEMIHSAIAASLTPQVTPQVKALLHAVAGEMTPGGFAAGGRTLRPEILPGALPRAGAGRGFAGDDRSGQTEQPIAEIPIDGEGEKVPEGSAIDILPIVNFRDQDSDDFVVDLVNNPVGADTNPVVVPIGEFFATMGPWIIG